MNCDILKSKLILCEWSAFYFIEIAFIGLTLDEIKQCIVFSGTLGILYMKNYVQLPREHYETRYEMSSICLSSMLHCSAEFIVLLQLVTLKDGTLTSGRLFL